MSINSKYVALKNYIPLGSPKEDDFEIKEKVLKLNEEKNIHVKNSFFWSAHNSMDKHRVFH